METYCCSYLIGHCCLLLTPPGVLQALKEAFDTFLNKGVAGSSSAELLATFCDNILKKGGSEKLSDDAIEDSLEKVGYPLFLSSYFCIF